MRWHCSRLYHVPSVREPERTSIKRRAAAKAGVTSIAAEAMALRAQRVQASRSMQGRAGRSRCCSRSSDQFV
jgi:hypothetical protein